MTETEDLDLEIVAGYTGRLQALGRGDPVAVLVHKDRVEDWVEVRVAIAIQVLEAAEVDLDPFAYDPRRQVADNAAFALCFLQADPAVAVGVGDGQGLQAHLQ